MEAIRVPKIVFVIPYRDREEQLEFFLNHMQTTVLKDMDKKDFMLLVVEQCDARGFNRGAMKNCGFLAMRNLFPNDYRDMTFVFNDVDSMPFRAGTLHYQTEHGRVKHFFGFTFALGGIFSITGNDFERSGGFPNFWQYGFEDNALQRSVSALEDLQIDRSNFFPIFDKAIIQFSSGDGTLRTVNEIEYKRHIANDNEGFSHIQDLQYGFIHKHNHTHLRVTHFDTPFPEYVAATTVYDIRNGSNMFPKKLPPMFRKMF